MSPPARIVLVGSMGSGKSTVMEILADRLDCPGLDTDRIVEEREGMTVSQVFAAEGEDMFRSLELSALEASLAHGAPVVVATGGGIVETPAARRLLEAEPAVVHLRVSPAVALERIGSTGSRPLLRDDPAHALAALEERRRAWWAQVANAIVDVDGLSAVAVADEVLSRLEVAA